MRINIYTHIVNTWLLALALHPVFLVGQAAVAANGSFTYEVLRPDTIGLIALFSAVLSIPALFISMIFFRLIILSAVRRSSAGLFMWCMAIVLSVILEIGIPMILVARGVDTEIFLMGLPGAAAGVLSALIRCRQFSNLFLSLQCRSIAHLENEVRL